MTPKDPAPDDPAPEDTPAPRTLILLRHAKSAWPQDIADLQRPLAGRGRRDAPAVGRWLRQQAPTIDLAVCSPAVRARQTWELAAAQLDDEPPVRYDERLYGASLYDTSATEVFLAVTRELPAHASAVLLIGHNPSLEDFLELLTGATEVLKTSAIAVMTTPGTWEEASPGSWTLEALAMPRG
ncbi:MAG: SixA phosphatase family protein [Pseudonocardiaceae bacterium]